mmetsp:Transcript_20478/g.36586  ORF Transcript_20478/g.36586 Transcript_20478/m.36586 type:complete len:99 (-) Transcript_20478:1177-1473(-)
MWTIGSSNTFHTQTYTTNITTTHVTKCVLGGVDLESHQHCKLVALGSLVVAHATIVVIGESNSYAPYYSLGLLDDDDDLLFFSVAKCITSTKIPPCDE